MPYDLGKSYDFSEGFILGYVVEHYEDAFQVCLNKAQKEMQNRVREEILMKYTYDSIKEFNLKCDFSNEKYQYSVVPIYQMNFAYKNSDNYKQFKYIVDKIIIFRTYNEVIKLEELHKVTLSKLADFTNIRKRILSLQAEQYEVNKKLCYEKSAVEYRQFLEENAESSKNFLYQISKQQNMYKIHLSCLLHHICQMPTLTTFLLQIVLHLHY